MSFQTREVPQRRESHRDRVGGKVPGARDGVSVWEDGTVVTAAQECA